MVSLFIHGLGQSKDDWNEVIRRLQVSDCYVPNIVDFAQNNFEYNTIYANFKKYCDSFSEKINLCGLSLGSVLSLHYAIENPQKVNSLILIATQYKMPRRLLSVQNILFELLPRRTFETIGISKNEMILLTSSMMDIDFSKQLNNVKANVTIICGKKDFFNKKASITMSKKIKNAKLFLISNAGHQINKDSSTELVNILKQLECFTD